MSWEDGELAGFDLETTGVNVNQDRVVTGCVFHVPALDERGHREPPTIYSWLADPGIEIPTDASDVHGITTEHAREHGAPADEVLEDMMEILASFMSRGVPIVGANLQYDFTLLDRDARRHGLAPLSHTTLEGGPAPVIDIMVIDRAIDPYRKGGRKLGMLAEYYGVPLGDDAHDSTADARAATRIAWKLARLGRRKPTGEPLGDSIEGRGRVIDVGAMKLRDLHVKQVEWKAKQAAGLADWLRKKGENADDVRPEWPFIPLESDGKLF